MADTSDLRGQIVARIGQPQDGSELIFFLDEDVALALYHEQDCCESDYLEDVAGDIQDLVGTQIWQAEEVSNKDYVDTNEEQWTFYLLRTIKGSVTLRWYGSSNGYYSTAVDAGWRYRGQSLYYMHYDDAAVARDLIESRYDIRAT